MAQTYNKMKIDIKEPVTDIITAKQNDSNSRFLDVYLYDGGVPIDLTGHEVRIYMLKADGTEVFNNGEITNATAGRCQFELTDQALGAYGKLLCEISIWYDNVQILTSQTFDIHVVKNLRTAGSIESSNEYGALVVLYQNLYEAIDLMTTMVEQFGEPGEVADAASIATFWQMLEYLYSVNDAALKNASVSEELDKIGMNTDGEDSGTLFGVVNPLSGLITELGNKIYNRVADIEGEYLVASNTVVKTFISSETSFNSQGGAVLGKFTSNFDGTIKLKVTMYIGRGTNTTKYKPTINVTDENNNMVGSEIICNANSYSNFEMSFPVKADGSYSINRGYSYDSTGAGTHNGFIKSLTIGCSKATGELPEKSMVV